MTKKKLLKEPMQKTPKKFTNFADCVSWVKKSTYLIVRGEKNGELIQWTTLGTGVIVASGRLITCAHVMRGGKGHEDGSYYYFLRHDDSGNWHTSVFALNEGKNLFIYDNYDLAIVHLEKQFYQDGDKIFKPKNEYVKINKKAQPIGTDIGILGYPNCQLTFLNGNLQLPQIGNIILRTDKGVINSKYKTTNGIIYNEFTIQFNHGNSGGPIFTVNDGCLIGLVQGYNENISNIKPIFINEKTPEGKKTISKDFVYHKSYYSIGIPVENYFNILKEHQIIE